MTEQADLQSGGGPQVSRLDPLDEATAAKVRAANGRIAAVVLGADGEPQGTADVLPRFPEDALTENIVKLEAWLLEKPYMENLVAMGPVIAGANRPFYLEVETARDFYRMSFAALQAGVLVAIDVYDPLKGFRTFEDQKRLRRERHNPDGSPRIVPGKKWKGPAAIEGKGNHQQGRAVDFTVGITYDEFSRGRGKTNKVYDWLVANAGQFGFAQPDVYGADKTGAEGISEPWHWVHVEKKAVGPVPSGDDLEKYEQFIYASRARTLVVSGIVPKDVSAGRCYALYQASADLTARALGIAKASRSKLRELTGASGIYGADRISRYAAGNAPAGRVDSARGMAPGVSDFWMYDFNTGQYGGTAGGGGDTPGEEEMGD